MRRFGFILALAIAACEATPPPEPPPPPPPAPAPIVVEPESAELPPPIELGEEELPPAESAEGMPPPMARRSLGAPVATDPTNCETFSASLKDGEQKMSCISVLYGTNRTVSEDRAKLIQSDKSERKKAYFDQGDLFSVRPDGKENCEPNAVAWAETPRQMDVCHLGELVISVPASRDKKLDRGGGTYKAASSGSKISKRSIEKYFTLFDHRSYDGDPWGFADRVQEILYESESADGHAFVFIHGFNVPFRNAAFRTAQLKYDMDFDGPAFFFSWPSNGSLLDYLSDQEDADLSVDALVRFLRFTHSTVNANGKQTKLHIIAHSMGTRVTAQALARLSDFEDSPKFGSVIFAAGDLDTNLFEEWMGASARLYDGVTIYTSRQDRAVGFSGWLRNLSSKMTFWGAPNDKKRRIGFYEKTSSPSTFELPSINGEHIAKTIDISSAAATSFLFKVRHSVYAESKIITDDIRYLFDHPYAPPEARSPDFRKLCEGDAHWTYVSKKEAAKRRAKECPA